MGKETKSRKGGKEGKNDSEESREDYIPFDTEDSQEMHLDMKEDETPQTKKGKRKLK